MRGAFQAFAFDSLHCLQETSKKINCQYLIEVISCTIINFVCLRVKIMSPAGVCECSTTIIIIILKKLLRNCLHCVVHFYFTNLHLGSSYLLCCSALRQTIQNILENPKIQKKTFVEFLYVLRDTN